MIRMPQAENLRFSKIDKKSLSNRQTNEPDQMNEKSNPVRGKFLRRFKEDMTPEMEQMNLLMVKEFGKRVMALHSGWVIAKHFSF